MDLSIRVVKSFDDQLCESSLLVLSIVALVLYLVADNLVEVAYNRINLGLSCKIESFFNRREVFLHVVVKKNFEVHWVQE